MSDPINSAALAEGTVGEKNPYLATIEAAQKAKLLRARNKKGRKRTSRKIWSLWERA